MGCAASVLGRRRIRDRSLGSGHVVAKKLLRMVSPVPSSTRQSWILPTMNLYCALVPRVGCKVPPTVVDSTTLADFPPTVLDSAQQQSAVWPDAQVQSNSEGGIMSVQEFPQTTVDQLSDTWNWIANMSPHSRSEGVVFMDVLKL